MLYMSFFRGCHSRGVPRQLSHSSRGPPRAIWDWYQELGSDKSVSKIFRLGRERVKIFAIDETEIIIAGRKAYFFLAYEPFEKRILGPYLTWQPNSIVVEMFLKDLRKMYGRHQVWTDGAWYYASACNSLGWEHRVYGRGSWLWEVMERAVQYVKDRTEAFDDLFPCRSHGSNCRLKHVWNWINVFFLHHQPMYKMFIDSIMEEMREKSLLN